MTTDTRPKQASAAGAGFTVGGMAKGAAMIHPKLATMLAVVTTDYPLERGRAGEVPAPGRGGAASTASRSTATAPPTTR